MAISEEKLKELIKTDYSLEKISSICTDGKNLLTRIPKDVVELIKIKKELKEIKKEVDIRKYMITLIVFLCGILIMWFIKFVFLH